jgi:hypothetical protein
VEELHQVALHALVRRWTKESLARKGRYPFKKIVGAGVSFAPPLGTSWFSLEKSGIG